MINGGRRRTLQREMDWIALGIYHLLWMGKSGRELEPSTASLFDVSIALRLFPSVIAIRETVGVLAQAQRMGAIERARYGSTRLRFA